jgi:hypothetical protein
MNIPKLHSLQHYIAVIKLYGTMDNYNTEYTERLHIDLAKDAYHATNCKDEYSQMTIWLERKEKILRHDKFIQWCMAGRNLVAHNNQSPVLPVVAPERQLRMTKHPTVKSVSFDKVITDYGATFFKAAFARFVVQTINPSFTRNQIENAISNVQFYFSTVQVYHKIKFCAKYPAQVDHESKTLDSIHVKPARKDPKRHRQIISGRFDTVLISDGTGGGKGVQGNFTLLS